MLTLARHLAAPLAGYHQPDHPVQRQIAATLAEMAGVDALAAPAIDGCGVPAFPMSLAQLARALARLADPRGLGAVRRAACEQIRAAMTAHPRLVAGSGRACTAIMTAAPGLVVKTGAEGVYAAALPSLGVGLALKVEDGASRAAPVALLALLEALGALPGGSARRARRDRAAGHPQPRPPDRRPDRAGAGMAGPPGPRRAPERRCAAVIRGRARAGRGAAPRRARAAAIHRGLSSPQGRASTLASWPNISICCRSRCS